MKVQILPGAPLFHVKQNMINKSDNLQNDELLDVVDKNDSVIGTMRRSDVYNQGLKNFRVINVFVINSNGELWIPRRAADKRIFPFCLDMGVGGHVESGETYEEALKRETQEELNIDITKAQVSYLGHLTPHDDDMSAFMNVYEIRMDNTPNYNTNDFVEYYWLKAVDLLNKINNGDSAKSDLPKLVKRFY